MRLMAKRAVLKKSDSSFGKQIDCEPSREEGYPVVTEKKAGILRKTAGVGFIITGVITGIIAAISLLIGVVLLIPCVVAVFKQYFGRVRLPGKR